MNDNINSLDNQYVLNTPLSFILQSKKITDIETIYDDNGWNVLHCAIANADIPKIKELMYFEFNCKGNSVKNIVPKYTYIQNENKKTECVRGLNKIPFCLTGFTPIHLALFLFHHYNNLSEAFFYQGICDKYRGIISLFLTKNENVNTLDGDEYSLFDYAFLLEDLSLIDLIHMYDENFSTLNKVSASTAKKILEMMDIKYSIKSAGFPHIVDLLSKKILHDELDLKLNENKTNIENNSIQKI